MCQPFDVKIEETIEKIIFFFVLELIIVDTEMREAKSLRKNGV